MRCSLWRGEDAEDVEKIVYLLRPFEDAIQAVGVYDGEGLLIEAIKRDRPKAGDVVLEKAEEAGLFGRQLRVPPRKFGETRRDRFRVQPHDGPNSEIQRHCCL